LKSCKKPILNRDESPEATKKALCFAEDWRLKLCKCPECLVRIHLAFETQDLQIKMKNITIKFKDMYQKLNCEFLLDTDDSLTSYENRAKSAKQFSAATSGGTMLDLATSGLGLNDTCMKALEKLDRVHQVEMIHGG